MTSPKPLAAKCPVCKKPLIRNGTAAEGIYWYEHEVSSIYDPVVVIFEADLPDIDPSKLYDLFSHYHRQLDPARAPPGEISRSEGGGGPMIVIPTYAHKGD